MENKQNIKDLIQKFYPHAKEKLGFDHPVRVIMRQDAENAQQSLGKTAYYDPTEKLIVLYITDRHPKDVLRSFSHELVHHAQNCRGELDDLSTDAHYAKDGKGREIEEEAYLQGNLNLRDYEDSIKFEGVNEMKLTKSQLKGLIEQTIEKITEKKFPDLTGDGKVTQADILKGRGVKLEEKEPEEEQDEKEKNRDRSRSAARAAKRTKEKRGQKRTNPGYQPPDKSQSLPQKMHSIAKGTPQELEEQQMDMAAIANVMEELRQLSDMNSSASRNLQRMGHDQFFTVLADKLERAMEAQVASLGSSGEVEEDVDEMHCGGNRDDENLEEQVPPKPKLPKNWRKLPYNSKIRDDYRKWMEKYGKKSSSKSRTADAKKQIDFMKSLGDKDPIAAATADPKKTADAKKQIAFLKSLGDKDPIAAATADPEKTADAKKQIAFMKGFKLEENNDAWYNSNLFESLVSKWTKEGDK